VVDKYTGSGFASYHGTLEFLPGLGLLQTTAIMPNTFIDTDTYENTVSGLPYAMLTDSLKFGLYLTGNTFARYYYTESGYCFFENLSGNYPLIYLENKGTSGGFAGQGPYPKSRNVAGFQSMDLKFLGIADTISVGKFMPNSTKETAANVYEVFPNPASGFLQISGLSEKSSVCMVDLKGRVLLNERFDKSVRIDVSRMPNGLYLFRIYDELLKKSYSRTINIMH